MLLDRLDLFVDLGCPWCYLGVHRLRVAARSTEAQRRISVHPGVLVQAADDAAPGGHSDSSSDQAHALPRPRFGDPSVLLRRLRGALESEGLAFDPRFAFRPADDGRAFGLIRAVLRSTADLEPVQSNRAVLDLVVAVYEARLGSGHDIASMDVLLALPRPASLDHDAAVSACEKRVGTEGEREFAEALANDSALRDQGWQVAAGRVRVPALPALLVGKTAWVGVKSESSYRTSLASAPSSVRTT